MTDAKAKYIQPVIIALSIAVISAGGGMIYSHGEQKIVNGVAGEAVTADIGSVLRGVPLNVEVDVSSTGGLSLYIDGMLEGNDPAQVADFSVALTNVYLGSGVGADNHFLIVNELVLDPI